MFRLITDMCCDLTKEMCEEFGILAVPMSYTMDGRDFLRSEERRVGKECRSRWSPYH